jgi:hypothetical protein
MATTVVGGTDAAARFAAIAGELRLLKSAMSDMQGRLDSFLVEIGSQLNSPAEVGSGDEALEPQDEATSAVVIEAIQADAPAAGFAEAADLVQAEAEIDTCLEPIASSEVVTIDAVDAAQDEITVTETAAAEAIESEMQFEVPVASEIEITEPIAPISVSDLGLEAAVAESTAEIAVAAEVAEVETDAAALPISAPIAAVELSPGPQVSDTTALSGNVIALAERRVTPRAGRSAIVRAGRWAAAITLIVGVAALAAAGTGFAGQFAGHLVGHGELLLTAKHICAPAGEFCSLVLGTP